MTDRPEAEDLTLGGAIKDLGWFAYVLIGVGGFSTLAILEESVYRHSLELVQIFQWPLDGYHRIMRLLGAAVEPLTQPAVAWLNSHLAWNIKLDPVWRPLFALSMVFVLGRARNMWREGIRIQAVEYGITMGIGAMLGALLAGLFPNDGGWWAQGLRASAPIMSLVIAYSLGGTIEEIRNGGCIVAPFAGLLAFAMAAGLSFIPGLEAGSGVLTLGGLVALLGVYHLSEGLSSEDIFDVRVGLTILGGFVAAALILAADFALKALEAA